jgi:serine/threonine protein kinase
MTLQPGSRPVPNYPDYVLIRRLGAGAFGEVWHAHGPGGLGVALKFIRLDAQVLALELRSLEVMKSIRHPNLVSLFGAWQKDNCLILAMELCDHSLQDRLTEALDQKLPGIPLKELLSYMTDAATGLDALNAKQVQHRDVKPANLLLLNSGVKVADFGLAKALEHTVATNSGAGTLAYTAPECFKGKLTQQSDQYSLAVTYYHLRTGHLLFKGDQAQVMYAHLELEPDLTNLPPVEAAVLTRALAKEPAKRWATCKVFVRELIGISNYGTERNLADPVLDGSPTTGEVIQFEPNKSRLFYGLRCMDWLQKKEYDKAIDYFSEFIRLSPRSATAYRLRAWAWSEKKEFGNSIRDYEEAIRLGPEYDDAYHAFAWLLATCPQEEYRNGVRAIQIASKACELTHWKRGDLLATLAAAYAEADQFEEAKRYQIKALEDSEFQRRAGDEYRRRLELYKQKKPFRQSS